MKTKTTYILAAIFFISVQYKATAEVSSNPQFTVDKVLLENIESPWGMTFINKDTLLFTEKRGKLWRYIISSNTKTEITGLPAVATGGQGGLLDIALHPDFGSNNYVYLTYSTDITGGRTTAVGRGTLVNNQLQNFTELFRALSGSNSGNHFSGRIVFDHENHLYLAVGDRAVPSNAQNLNNHLGKIMRLKDDGSVPDDNPFVGASDTMPEIYSYGHRNIQGMVFDFVNEKLYAHEHGPKGGDELNLIETGNNYGWPAITFGENYDGTEITPDTAKEGMEQPITYWVPSIAPSGLTIIKSAGSENNLMFLLGALAGQHLHFLQLENDKVTVSSKSLQNYARFRDVRQAQDGKLYALTESPNRLVRLAATGLVTSTAIDIDDNNPGILFPNPSEQTAILKFSLSSQENVEVKILSPAGKIIRTVINTVLAPGEHQMLLEAGLEKGIYFVEIIKGNEKEVLKWVIL